MGSLGDVRTAGRERMRRMQSAVQDELTLRLDEAKWIEVTAE